jgi:hypothetical protein
VAVVATEVMLFISWPVTGIALLFIDFSMQLGWFEGQSIYTTEVMLFM